MIGRGPDCDRIDAVLDSARRSTSAAVIFRGHAGIGKTSLLDYALTHRDGFTVCHARGTETEAGLPYAGLLDLLRPFLGLVGELPQVQREALEGALALGPPPGAPALPFAVSTASLGLLAVAAESGPILLAIDDAHSLDAETVQAVTFALRRLYAEPVAAVITLRPDPPSSLAAAGFPLVELAGLSEPDTRLLLMQDGSFVPVTVAAEIWAATGGLPLAVRTLRESLTAEQLAGHAPLPDPLPTHDLVERAFGTRVTDLPDSERTLLTLAALGTGAMTEVAAAARHLGLGPVELREAELAGVAQVRRDGVSFVHPLMRAAVRENASDSERRAAHDALAVVTTGSVRARHRAAATQAPAADVADDLAAAGVDALARGGLSAAGAAFLRAAELTPDDELRARRLVSAVQCQLGTGQMGASIPILASALATVSDPATHGDATLLLARVKLWTGSPDEARQDLRDEATRLATSDPRRAVIMLWEAGFADIVAARVDHAVQAGTEAWRVATASGDDDLVLLAGLLRGSTQLLAGDATGARPLLTAWADAVDPRRISPADQPPALPWAATLLFWLGERKTARLLLDAWIEAARRGGAPAEVPYALARLSEIDLLDGEWTRAYARATEAVELVRATDQW
ncbi:MAG: AAA family ATPase, partial [Frankia sp.]|nr:AAA family ATPase [Frankia sp.]